MKTYTHFYKLMTILLLVAGLVGCSSEDDDNVTPVNPDAADINAYFEALPEWDNTPPEAAADKVVNPELILHENNTPYKCQVLEKNLVESLEKIISVGTNQGKVWPGALVEGNSLATGDLKLINLGRAPITITADLPISEASTVIEEPNSVTVGDAINEFKIAAGNLEEGSQAGAGIMNFEVNEAASFHQSMLSLGISGGFTEPQSQVGLDASASVSTERGVSTHTVAARFVQEKFTVRIADDLISGTSGFFAQDVSMEDVKALEASGKWGGDNIPLYIESVTYGRILIFTTESTRAESADALSAALNASMANYVEGGGELTDAQRTILDNSTTRIYSAGGTEEGANAVIAGLDWSKFFVAAPVSTTVPIAFTVRTLGGRQTVRLNDSAIFQTRNDCQAPVSYDITVTLEEAVLDGGVCLNCKYTSRMKEGAEVISTPFAFGSIFGVWEAGSSSRVYTMSGFDNTSSFELTSGYCNTVAPGGYCAIQDYKNKRSHSYSWPYQNLVSGNTYLEFNISETFSTIRFKYKIRKTPNY